VNRSHATLQRAALRLSERLEELEPELATGGDAAWTEYRATVNTLAAITTVTTAEAHGAMLTTKQLANSLQVSPKTVLRRAKRGELNPLRLGQRGRAALRFTAEAYGR
jgi:hypothetical protein